MMPETDSEPTPSRAAARAVLIAGSAGVIAGSLHGLGIWVQRFGMGRFTFHSRDAIWMAPLGTALIFGGLALVAVLPALLFRWRIPTALALGVFGFLGLFTVLLPYGEISRWAATLLAVAVGVQLARGARREPEHARRRTLRIGAGFAVAMAGLGIGQRAVLAIRQAQGVGALRPAASGAPSILLIILDTVRGENLSLYGYPRPTFTALEKWAARGVVFEHAIATAPWTLPSHGSLFTGLPSRKIGGGWFEPISDSAPTLAEVLRDRGYRTAGFAANLLYTSYETGLDRGFLEYRDYPLHLRQVLWHSPLVQTVLVKSLLRARSLYAVKKAARRFSLETDSRPGDQYIPAPAITDGFLRWQERLGDRPFFAFLNYFDAHGPYRAAPAYLARFAATEKERDRYDAAIAYLDSELDRLLSTLQARGALDRTIVVDDQRPRGAVRRAQAPRARQCGLYAAPQGSADHPGSSVGSRGCPGGGSGLPARRARDPARPGRGRRTGGTAGRLAGRALGLDSWRRGGERRDCPCDSGPRYQCERSQCRDLARVGAGSGLPLHSLRGRSGGALRLADRFTREEEPGEGPRRRKHHPAASGRPRLGKRRE